MRGRGGGMRGILRAALEKATMPRRAETEWGNGRIMNRETADNSARRERPTRRDEQLVPFDVDGMPGVALDASLLRQDPWFPSFPPFPRFISPEPGPPRSI